MTQKWIYENGLYFPVKGETTSENILGKGVFKLEASSPNFSRIGLRRIADESTFDFKVYDLGWKTSSSWYKTSGIPLRSGKQAKTWA